VDSVDQIRKYNFLRQIRNSRRQFWRLYWGPLVLVQQPELEGALDSFGEILRKWEDLGKNEPEHDAEAPAPLKKELDNAVEAIHRAIEKEIGRRLVGE
jgi:hypothetical protein